MTRAFVFPGQGSQSVGMGAALADAFPAAREVFEEVDDALGQKLSKLMREGPMEELTLTANTQPALMAHSIAAMRVLQTEAGADISNAMFVAGHSLGEYSALTAAGALSIADAARLLRTRGRAMQQAVPVGEGFAAVLEGAGGGCGEPLAYAQGALAATLASWRTWIGGLTLPAQYREDCARSAVSSDP